MTADSETLSGSMCVTYLAAWMRGGDAGRWPPTTPRQVLGNQVLARYYEHLDVGLRLMMRGDRT